MAAPARTLRKHAPPVRPARPRANGARRRKAKQRRVPFAAFALAVVSAMVLGLTGAQAIVAQGSFRLEELSRRAERLERQFGQLRLDAAEAGSLQRVAAWAQRRGFVVREPGDVHVVELETTRRVETDPDPAAPPALAVGGGGG